MFTVGPDGDHASLQSALTAALAPDVEPHHVRIQAGALIGDTVHVQGIDVTIEVSGGWNAGFTLRSDDPALTVLQGSGSARTLYVTGNLGTVQISNLTVTNPGAQQNDGTCVALQASGTLEVTLRDSVIRHCEGEGPVYCNGNGIAASASQDARITILANHVHDNRCEPSRASADVRIAGRGTGISAQAQENGSLLIADNRIEDNLARNFGEQSDGIGINAINYGEGAVEVHRNHILRNRVLGESVGEFNPVSQACGLFLATGVFGTAGGIEARGNRVADNAFEASVRSGTQVAVEAYGNGHLVFGDSAVLDGSGGFGALHARTDAAGSVLDLVNLTVAGNEGAGIQALPTSGLLSLSNSIASGNQAAVELHPDVVQANNLLDVPAGFVDPITGNYRLRADSPALDAGTAAPAGGLGSTDLDGGPRVVGSAVDIGAFERGSTTIFRHGFEDPS